jgi:hypothetical protein
MKPFLLLFLALLSVPARAEFGLHVGGHFGYGKMGDEANDINQDRSMGSFDLQAMPGYRFLDKLLMAGVMLDYRFLGQLEDKSATLSDFSGRSFLIGLGAMLDLPTVKFILSYDFHDRHNISLPKTTYKGKGWHFLLGYKVAGSLCVDLEYVVANYDSQTLLGEDSDLSGTDLSGNTRYPISHDSLAFGLSWTY